MIVRPEIIFNQIRDYRRELRESGSSEDIDVRTFIESKCKIITKEGELKSLIFNPAQEKLFNIIMEEYDAGRPVRIIVLKIRQIGISTLNDVLIYTLTYINPYKAAMIISFQDDQTKWLYEMVRRFYYEMPYIDKQRRPLTSPNPKVDELKFAPPHYSTVMLGTAKNIDIARGTTLHYVHGSEVAKWKNAQDLCSSINEAIPKLPGTMKIWESTAWGIGNMFWQDWKAAEAGKGGMIPVFLSFKDYPYYSIPLLPGEKLQLTPDQNTYYKKHKLEPATMKWIVDKFETDCRKDWGVLKREYPVTADEAFSQSGNPWFDLDALELMKEKYLREPEIECQLAFESKTPGSAILIKDKTKEESTGPWIIQIWKMPEHGEEYLLTMDVSEGVGIHWSIGQVWQLHRYESSIVLEQVAKYLTNRVNSKQAAVHIYMLGSLYNWAMILIERNSMGLVTLRELENECVGWPQTYGGYPHMYYERKQVTKEEDETRRLGYQTGRWSKGPMLAIHKSNIEDQSIILHSKRTFNEHFGFYWDEVNENWFQQNPDEETNKVHDDEVMSCSMAWPCLTAYIKLTRVMPQIKSGDF